MKSLTAFFLFISLFTFSFAQTPSCSSSASTVSSMWSKYGSWVPSVSFQVWTGQANRAINAWNTQARNSWKTIGPRSLRLPSGSGSGTIMGQTNRTFVTPPSHKNSVTITLRKTDGKAKTGVTICTTTRNGSRRTVHSYTFNNGNYNRTKTFVIPNAKGKVISINMRNYSVGNKFKYTVSAR